MPRPLPFTSFASRNSLSFRLLPFSQLLTPLLNKLRTVVHPVKFVILHIARLPVNLFFYRFTLTPGQSE